MTPETSSALKVPLKVSRQLKRVLVSSITSYLVVAEKTATVSQNGMLLIKSHKACVIHSIFYHALVSQDLCERHNIW